MCFHKDVEVCRNRIRMLRQYNPDLPIYGVYGGDSGEEERYRRALGGLLDDFYSFECDRDSEWKWVNFDVMIAQWYERRGKDLAFDTVVSIQWDQLILAPITELFPDLKPNEILFSGLRPAREVMDWWYWVSKRDRPGAPPEYGFKTYTTFLNHLKDTYNYSDEPVFSQSFFCLLPRTFLKPFSESDWSVPGYGEYRMPMYAQAFGVPFCQTHHVDAWWPSDPERSQHPIPERIVESDRIPPYAERTLTAARIPLPLKVILQLSKAPDGPKLFHPYYRIFPLSITDWMRLLRDKVTGQR